jgi:hypothetical protein
VPVVAHERQQHQRGGNRADERAVDAAPRTPGAAVPISSTCRAVAPGGGRRGRRVLLMKRDGRPCLDAPCGNARYLS